MDCSLTLWRVSFLNSVLQAYPLARWISSWWLNQPIWKRCSSNFGSFPQGSRWKWKIFEITTYKDINPYQTAQHFTISHMKGCNPLTLSMSQLTGGQFNPRNLNNPYQSLLQSTPFSKHQAGLIVTCSSGKYPKTSRNMTSWWFQPIWKIWVKMGSSSPNMGENKISWTSTAFFRDTDWQLGSPWKISRKNIHQTKKISPTVQPIGDFPSLAPAQLQKRPDAKMLRAWEKKNNVLVWCHRFYRKC